MTTLPDIKTNYSLDEMRRICREITSELPEIALYGHKLRIHDIHPDLVPACQPVHSHEHSFYEGHFFLQGGGIYLTGGEQHVGMGGALLHAPHMQHNWASYHLPSLRLLIWFTLDPMATITRPEKWPIVLELYYDIFLLFAEVTDHLPGWQQRIEQRISIIVSRLLANNGWTPQTSTATKELSYRDTVHLVEQFFHDNLARPLTLADITANTGICERTLCRNFKQLTGETVMECLQTMRMTQAASLLADGNDSLPEIGEKIGIHDPSYLCRRFKKHFNMTPAQYRRRARGRAS